MGDERDKENKHADGSLFSGSQASGRGDEELEGYDPSKTSRIWVFTGGWF